MQRHSRIALNMIAIVGRRLGEAQERLRELATQSADRRIARTLLRLLNQAGCPTDVGVRIEFPLRRKDIADIAGTTLHTVSRILVGRSEEHTSELQSLMRISYAVFCFNKKNRI